MAGIWGSENIVADHRDLQANTMAVDKTGQFVILAGRRHMGIVNLDNPTQVVHKTNRHSKWDVTTAEWNPHENEYFALACNQRTEIYSWNQGNVSQTASLKAHTRSISDQNWSTFDVNVLATASIDTFIYLWDTRDPRKPTISLSAVAGASQVKWSKFKNHMIATSHEGDIRLWDTRKGTSPVKYITAHLMKIHNIDWCPYEENILATSSQDCTVKFWDVTVPAKIEENLQVPCPVWRAQYTPFGCGLVTVVVPPLRRGDNSLLLWNMRNTTNPVHTFFGHSDVVVEFGWRKPIEDSKDYHLVTFAKDHCLRTWIVDIQMQKACGHMFPGDEDVFMDSMDSMSLMSMRDPDPPVPSSPPGTPAKIKEKVKEVTPATSAPSQPQNLQQEFSLVNLNIPNLTINEMDATKRSCTVTAISGKFVVFLKLTFPVSYPYNNPPSFQFFGNTNIDEDVKAKILKVLKKISQQQVKRNRSCLEPCLRQLVTTLNSLTAEDKNSPTGENLFYIPPGQRGYVPAHYGYTEDVSCPFPRTSGARFCGADLLVVFTRPQHLHHINAPTDDTPRSLSALAAYLASHVVLPIKGRTASSSPAQYSLVYQPLAQSPSGEAPVSISSFYHQDRVRKRRSLQERRSSGPKQLSNSGAVLIYSISKLLPLNYNLALNYVFDTSDIVGTCAKNASVAAKEGLKDLVQVWSIAGLIYSASSLRVPKAEYPVPWQKHPFGHEMLMSLILHYGSHYDVQTAAMLACIFHEKCSDLPTKKTADTGLGGNISAGGSPYHTVVPADNTFEGWNLIGAEAEAVKRNRSNSWSQEDGFFDEIDAYNEMVREEEREFLQRNSHLLNPAYTAQFDNYKTVYADVLYRWNLLEQRAQILKTLSVPPKPHSGVEFLTECQYCCNDGTSVQCKNCKKFCFICVICCIAVKGCSSFCLMCGHGGHTQHIEEWFSDMDVCPSGCGCRCVDYMLF